MIIHFFTDFVLPGNKANKIAIKGMLEGFLSNNEIKKIYFYYPGNQFKIKKSNKIELINFKIPFYADPTEIEKDYTLSFLYRILFGNRVFELFVFCRSIKLKSNSNVFVRGTKAMRAIYLSSLFRKFKYIVEIQEYEFGKSFFHDFFIKLIMNRAYKIITVSYFTKKNWIKNGINNAKTIILTSGVKSTFINKWKAKDIINLPKNVKRVVYIGSSNKEKGSYLLFKVAPRLKNYIFIIVGDKKYYPKRIHSNIVLTGRVKHNSIPDYLSLADAFIVPNDTSRFSRLHTSPMKIWEYLAFDKPIIASQIPSLIQPFKKFQGIYYFLPENIESMKATILKALRSKVTINNKKELYDHTWESRADKIINFFHES